MNHTFTMQYSTPGAQKTAVITETGSSNLEADIAVASNAVNQAVDVQFKSAEAKSLYILADQNMTLKTNSSGSPQETLTLKAGVPVVVTMTDHAAQWPFAGNVTQIYLTNTSNPATAGTLSIRYLYNP